MSQFLSVTTIAFQIVLIIRAAQHESPSGIWEEFVIRVDSFQRLRIWASFVVSPRSLSRSTHSSMSSGALRRKVGRTYRRLIFRDFQTVNSLLSRHFAFWISYCFFTFSSSALLALVYLVLLTKCLIIACYLCPYSVAINYVWWLCIKDKQRVDYVCTVHISRFKLITIQMNVLSYNSLNARLHIVIARFTGRARR